MATIGDVTIRIGATTRQLESDLKRAERALAQTGKKFSDLGAKLSLNLSLPIAAIGAASFKMASDVEESLNKVRVAFGNSSTEVEAFADTTLESFGIARGSALDMAALFGDMATSMGITQSDAAKLSTSLVGLAGDLASFKNIALSEVQTALSGIFTGETESLKRLGVVMLETNLEAFALEQGIRKKYKTMTQAEKVALRYQFVLNATKNAQGDFARTSDGAANQMRIFQESLKEVGSQFGSVLLPILTPVIKAFNNLLKELSNLTETQKQFIVGIAAVTATLGPLLSLVGSLYDAYAKAATNVIKLGIVTTNAGTAAEVTSFSFRKLVASLGPIALGIAVVSAAIAAVTYALGETKQAQDEINTTQKEAATIIAREGVEVKRLVSLINAETTSKEDKRNALAKLQQIQPEYFKGIKNERDMVAKVNEQYGLYVAALQKKAAAQVAEVRFQKNAEDRLNTQEELAKVNKEIFDLEKRTPQRRTLSARDGGAEQQQQIDYLASLSKRSIELNQQLKDITASDKKLASFINEYDKLLTVTGKPVGGGDGKESPLTKTLNGLNNELVILERRLNAGLITPTEFASEKLQILEKRFEAVVDAGIGGDLYTKYERDLYRAADSQDQLARSTEYFLSFANLIPGTFNVISQAVATNITEFDKLDNALKNKLISPVEYASQRIDLLKNTLRELSDKGLDETNPKFAEYKTQLDEAEVSQQKYNQALQYTLQLAGLLPGVLNPVAQAAQKTSVQVNNIFDKLGQEFGPKVKELAEGIASAIGSVFQTLGTIYDVQGQKLDAYEKKQRAAIENGYYSEEQKKKAIEKLEEDLAKKRTVLARKRALADKASAIFSATVNGANAVVQALNAPFGLGIPLAAIVGGLVAAQIAAIASAPLPSLAIGTDRVKSDGMAYLHKGEAVVPADVVSGGFSGSNGTQVYGRLSGIDLLLSNQYAGGYYNRLR